MKIKIKNTFSLISLAIIIATFLSGCSGADVSGREGGALIGGALGAGLGAIVGHKTGSTGAGIAIGGATGALAGGLFGNSVDNQHRRLDERDEQIRRQETEISENKKILDQLKNKGFDVYQTDRGIVVNLPDVLFSFGSDKLTSDAVRKIEDISNIVRQYPENSISVEGHTDSVGTLSYNQELSEKRARNVADELVAQGVSRRRVTSKGYGETRPITTNTSETGRSMNRRVEVVIY